MGFEAAQQAMNAGLPAESTETTQTADPIGGGESTQSTSTSNGSNAPDAASNVFDLTKAEKFMWEGKEMTPDDLRKNLLRQQDYTKKTQQIAEDRRRFEEERRTFIQQQEETEKYNSNLDADIQNVLRDPSLESKFKEIYPQKYHGALDQALTRQFGDKTSPDHEVKSLKQQLQAINGRFQQQDIERAKTAFETEVRQNSEILDSNIARLATKYPHADEDSVLARAEYMATALKKDATFNDNFSKLLEKLYQENHSFHEKRYQQIYKSKVEAQKNKNDLGKDIGRGGGTPATAPTKMKLKDVKNHILASQGIS